MKCIKVSIRITFIKFKAIVKVIWFLQTRYKKSQRCFVAGGYFTKKRRIFFFHKTWQCNCFEHWKDYRRTGQKNAWTLNANVIRTCFDKQLLANTKCDWVSVTEIFAKRYQHTLEGKFRKYPILKEVIILSEIILYVLGTLVPRWSFLDLIIRSDYLSDGV